MLVYIGIAGLQYRRQGRELKREAHWVLSDKKLDLLLDEVVELREALHEHRVVEQADNPELTSERLRGHSQEDLDEMILLEEYQAVKATIGIVMGEIPTSWIWADEASGGVKGARLNLADGTIEWVDQPGCACGDAVQLQSIADFMRTGPPDVLPADVLAEMREALSIDSNIHRR